MNTLREATEASEQDRWREWVRRVCTDLDVPVSAVDIEAIHELSRDVAHSVGRPLAPVSTFILGLVLGLRSTAGASPDSVQAAAVIRRHLA
jgi:hypothetical protein